VKKKANTHRIKLRYKKEIQAFAKNLKRIRKKKAMTQEDVAYEANISFSSYNYAESGGTNVTLGMMLAIASGLKIKPKELLDF
jgi:transcriptional regulator with XRE-family HTH domain